MSGNALAAQNESIFAIAIAAVVVAMVVAIALIVARRRTKGVEPTREQIVDLANRWTPPSELQSLPIPRPVKFTGQGKLLVVVAIVLSAVGILVTWFMASELAEDRRCFELLEREGVPAKATVIRKWMRSGKSASYHVEYEYEAAGSLHRRDSHVSSNTYRAIEPGSRLEVRFARSEPDVSRLNTEKEKPAWLPLVPLLVFLLGVPIIAVQLLRQRRLLQTGRPVAALVTRVAQVKGGTSVSYQFIGATGNVAKGAGNVKASEKIEPGQTVTVLQDTGEPRRNTIYPPQFVKLDVPGT